MKKSLLIASLLAIASAAAVAQTAPAPSPKPGVTLGVAAKPGTPPAAPTPPTAPARLGPDPEQMAKHQVEHFDTNKDGKVSLEEFLAPATASFKRTDLNHDGFVTAAELVEVNKRQMEELMKMRANAGHPVAAPAAPAAPPAPAKPAAPVKVAK